MSKSDRVWTVLSMLEWGTEYFESKDIPAPRMSMEWILAHTLQLKRLDIYLNYDRPLVASELEILRSLVKRRAAHEPLQYITGSTDFMDCKIRVTPAVLIPRVETEQMVEILLNDFKEKKDLPVRLLDIGTGSGCIPVSIKKACSQWICAGMDISDQALEIAQENAVVNGAEVDFFRGDLLHIEKTPEIFNQPWDIVISNPPYITNPEKDDLEPEVKNHEPAQALFHHNPVELYTKIIEFAVLKGASLYLECNHKFAREISLQVIQNYEHVKLGQDYDKNDRFVIALNLSK